MQTTFFIGLIFALSPFPGAYAQAPATQDTLSPAAPIVRADPGQRRAAPAQIVDLRPNAGIFVRSDVSGGVETVSASENVTELRIVGGRADVTVHRPANHSQIVVDLPGGQISLIKDGLYTFNAATNTVRVLRGEAEAYLDAKDTSKGTKVRETQQLSFFDKTKLRAVNAYPYELTADLLPGAAGTHGDGPRNRSYGNGYEGYYPYYASGYGYPGSYGY